MRAFWNNPIVGIICLATICALIFLGVFGLLVPKMEHLTRAAMTTRRLEPVVALRVPVRINGSFSASMMTDVPLPPGPHSDPSLQFDIFDLTNRAQWEAGIIRPKERSYTLVAFVGERRAVGPFHITYLAPISDGPHRLEISRAGNTLAFSVDGRIAHRFIDMPVAPDANLRLQIGTAFGLDGERAIGSLWDVRISDATGAGDALQPRCSVARGGVSLIPVKSRWVLKGAADMSKSAVVTSCR